MNLHIFSIHDVKAHCYIHPFFLPEIDMAKRSFSDCINSDSHQFGNHPEDYTLFHIAEFNDLTGKLNPLLTPLSLGNGVDYLINTHQLGKNNGAEKPDLTEVSNEPPVLGSPES